VSVQILDEMGAHEEFPERLELRVDFGNGIANINRISIENSVEHLFRGWVEHKLADQKLINDEDASDVADFRRAIGIALNSTVRQPGMSRLIIMPSLVLLDMGSNSPSYREMFIGAVIVGAVSVPFLVLGGAGANVLTDIIRPYEAQMLQVGKTVVIKSESTLQQFVDYLKALQSQVSREDAYLDTRTLFELYTLYRSISNVAGGKLSISVTTRDGQSMTFELTAKEAANQLPRIERRLFGGPIKP